MIKLLKFLQLNLNLSQKKIIISLFDILLLILAIFISFIIKYESLNIYLIDNVYVFIIGIIIFIINSLIFNLNQQIIRTFNISNVIFLSKFIIVFTVLFSIFTFLFNFSNSPRSIPIFIGPIFFFIFVCSRLMLVYATQNINDLNEKIPILIYGAGSSGVYFNQLLKPTRKIIGYIDDDNTKVGRKINSISVFSYDDINDLIKLKNIKEIIVAIPRLNISQRKIFLKKLKDFQLKINFITLGQNQNKSKSNLDLDNIRLYDLIERDLKVNYDLNKEFFDKSVIITGAGGSIGSELSRQILMSEPKNLFLIDFSELNLFNLNKQLNLIKNQFKINTSIKFKLLNLVDKKNLELFFDEINNKQQSIDFVFHCAAYKHVHLVEDNKMFSFKNNMLSTINLANLSINSFVKKFVLISSDKAVRPKSMMGITKYLSEVYIKKISKKSEKTNFSIVRFGNVLGSSGSVLPIFRSQIENGGPITVTDPNATRFFMTIEEASYLVIQASIIAEKSEILLINMGKPVKVIDLAKKLLSFYGLNEKSKDNPEGVEIKITGLKKGEKLHEELLINEKSIKTINENLMVANEEDNIKISFENFQIFLNDIIENNSEIYLNKKLKDLNL